MKQYVACISLAAGQCWEDEGVVWEEEGVVTGLLAADEGNSTCKIEKSIHSVLNTAP